MSGVLVAITVLDIAEDGVEGQKKQGGCLASVPLYADSMVSSAPETNLKHTPLFAAHVKLGAKMIGFGGWNMPVYYSSILDEHQAVRRTAGLFDISHMGQLEVSGPMANLWLNQLLTNNVNKLIIGEGQYTLLLNPQGGVIDDLIVYRRSEGTFLLVVNAAKVEEDVAWLRSRINAEVTLINLSTTRGAVALQGPRSALVLQELGELPARNHLRDYLFDGVPVSIARTGYTGEDGFEIFFPAVDAVRIWQRILELGAPLELRPCGLGARDTLRLEVCYPLNGSDLAPDRTPIEAGLGFFVDLEKPDFVGREILATQKSLGPQQKLVAIRALDKCPPLRAHYGIFADDQRIGELTSGTQSPTLNYGIGLGYVPASFAKPGQKLEIDIRGRRFPATVEKKPLYKKSC
jgi:aminomethyltransferase